MYQNQKNLPKFHQCVVKCVVKCVVNGPGDDDYDS